MIDRRRAGELATAGFELWQADSSEPLQALAIAQVMPDDASGLWLLHMAQAKALWELGRRAEARVAAAAALNGTPSEEKGEKLREELGYLVNE